MTATPSPLSAEQHAAIREEVLAALSTAGAFCGECGFEPGEIGCSDCVRVREMYADALMPIVDRLRAELAAAHRALSGIEADAERADRKGYDLDTADILQQARDGLAAAPTAPSLDGCGCQTATHPGHWPGCPTRAAAPTATT